MKDDCADCPLLAEALEALMKLATEAHDDPLGGWWLDDLGRWHAPPGVAVMPRW